MYARWGSFAVGIALLLSPLALGYGSAAPILHDVAMGSLVCVATLAALEWPRARFVLVVPGVWLAAMAPASSEPAAVAVDLSAGAVLLALAAIPSARLARRTVRRAAGRDHRARARA
jgi:hypothetical protein